MDEFQNNSAFSDDVDGDKAWGDDKEEEVDELDESGMHIVGDDKVGDDDEIAADAL